MLFRPNIQMTVRLRIVQPIDQSWTVARIAEERPPAGWIDVFSDAKDELQDISEILAEDEQKYGHWYPLKKNIFRAFDLTPLNQVRVVIIGQDPYPQLNPNTGDPRAQGLSFSVSKDDDIPSSLRNIYRELANCIPGFVIPSHGDLTEWALQGILMLNMSLTVRPQQPGSHGQIWMGFIIKVLNAIAAVRSNAIFIMWGREAQRLRPHVGDHSIVLTSAHPSGLSAKGFFGNCHFAEVNKLLTQMKETPINWQITE